MWRTNESKAAEQSDTPVTQAISVPTTRAVPDQRGEFKDVQGVQATLRPQHLDPALIDRVTEDVIRRIDYRLRIERERRGL